MNIDPKINEQAVAIEKVHFVKTDRRVNPKKVNPFLYLEGNIPILISAPHAVRHIRGKNIKPSDEFTGSLVYLLQSLTGCHGLAVTKLYGGDPNWDKDCIYKEKISQIWREHDIQLVLDIHGAARTHPFDVDIGTMRGRSLLEKSHLLSVVRNKFAEAGLNGISIDHFSAGEKNTVTKFVAEELKIPALQIELNKQFRVPHQNGQAYVKAVHALVDVIQSITKNLV